jgi:hypothetical protein
VIAGVFVTLGVVLVSLSPPPVASPSPNAPYVPGSPAAIAALKQGPSATSTAARADPACRSDLRCWAEKGLVGASVRCRSNVERLAKNDFQWTDGWLEMKFSRYRWRDQASGTVTYVGDKIKLQNGFGAWQNHIYECDYDQSGERVLGVRAFAGRLPE